MAHEQWLKRWEEGNISFHEGKPNDLFISHYPEMDLSGHCLVPLCGKAVDMRWIWEHGHAVTGVEIAKRALQDFYQEHHWPDPLLNLTLVESDFLSFQSATPFDWIYDRAALIAMDPDQRQAYVDHEHSLLKPGGKLVLITVNYDTSAMQGPPHAVSPQDVRSLYRAFSKVEMLEARPAGDSAAHLRPKLSWIEESLWLMQK